MLVTTRTMAQMPWSRASRRIISPVSSSPKFVCSSSLEIQKPRKLILYSKPGCCLCDGLKEKLLAAFSLSSPTTDSRLHVQLQIRDITTNPDWERAYQYEIPVLAKLHDDGTEETLPRLSPRADVKVIRSKIENAFKD